MSDIILKQPNGQWCIWSTIVDDFIVEDATREDIIDHELERERFRLTKKINQIAEQGADYYYPPRDYDYYKELKEELEGK